MHTLLQINTVSDTAELINEEPVEKTLSIFELITSGGAGGMIIMTILFVLSIVAVSIFIERYKAIKKAGQLDENFFFQLKNYVSEGRLDAARDFCQGNPSPIARMMEKGITRIGRPLKDIAAAVENTGKIEVYRMEKNLALLATISGAAPMIGFLGTVIGMILAFHEMASAGGQIQVDMLAEGIYTAMTTTVAGLTVGILAYLGYNILVSKVDKVVYKMEVNATDFLDLLNEPV